MGDGRSSIGCRELARTLTTEGGTVGRHVRNDCCGRSHRHRRGGEGGAAFAAVQERQGRAGHPDRGQRAVVPDAALEELQEQDDGGQTHPGERVAVQLHCQQARRRHGQLPGTQRAAQSGGRREDGEGPLEGAAGGAGTGGLRTGLQRHMVAQAQAGHRREGHLLGPDEAQRHRRHRHQEHGHPDVVLGAGGDGHSGIAEPVQPESGRQRPVEGQVAPDGRPHREHAGSGQVHPRRTHLHRRQERGGGLVLQKGPPGGATAAALLQVLQRGRPLRQRERPAVCRPGVLRSRPVPLCV